MTPAGTEKCLDIESADVQAELVLSARGHSVGRDASSGGRSRVGAPHQIVRHCWLGDSVGAYAIFGMSAAACVRADKVISAMGKTVK